ncbi:RNA polymerase sigma factor [Bacteroidota bacterium]
MKVNPNLSDKAQKDFQIIQRALEGDEKAFADLMGRYRDSIYFLLLKMVNNKTDAEDLTIEAFGKAFKNIGKYSPSYAFSTWLFKIATNNCIDFMRRKKSNISVDNQITGYDIDSTTSLQSNYPGPDESLLKKEKIKFLHIVIEKLKPRYKTLIDLRYFKEYSYEEIADTLDLPLGTVKAQLFRARELLNNILVKTEKKY